MCKGCSPQRCEIPVSEQNPMQIACPTCDEAGCEECENEGWIKITECPRNLVGRETMDFIELADFAKKGSFPVTGGTLEQSQSFLIACRILWAEDSQAEQQQWSKQ